MDSPGYRGNRRLHGDAGREHRKHFSAQNRLVVSRSPERHGGMGHYRLPYRCCRNSSDPGQAGGHSRPETPVDHGAHPVYRCLGALRGGIVTSVAGHFSGSARGGRRYAHGYQPGHDYTRFSVRGSAGEPWVQLPPSLRWEPVQVPLSAASLPRCLHGGGSSTSMCRSG